MTTLLAEAIVMHFLLGMLLHNVFEKAGNKAYNGIYFLFLLLGMLLVINLQMNLCRHDFHAFPCS